MVDPRWSIDDGSRRSAPYRRAVATVPASCDGKLYRVEMLSPRPADLYHGGSRRIKKRRPSGPASPRGTSRKIPTCREDFSVLYYRMPRLLGTLALARGDGRYAKFLRSLARVKLLILDDWGPETLTPEQARELLKIVEDRYDAGSILVTSQVPVACWHDMIGIPTIADAILDRLVRSAYRIELSGDSLRKSRSA